MPPVAGLTLDQARAALAERTFTVGKTVTVFAPSVPAGTVVGPTDVRVLTEGSPVDLQIASSDSTVAHSPFTFTVASAPRLQAANRKLAGRTLMTNRARIDVTLDARPYHRIQRWHFRHVGSGAAVVQMKLTYPLKPGMYQLYWKATSDATGTVKRSITSLVIAAPHAKAHIAKPAQIVVIEGNKPTRSIRTPLHGHLQKLSAEQAYIYATYQDVSVIVVDADVSGLPLLRTLRRVFPQTTLLALSKKPATLRALARLGATPVVSGTNSAKLAALFATALKR